MARARPEGFFEKGKGIVQGLERLYNPNEVGPKKPALIPV
jgi:hypothetical protein